MILLGWITGVVVTAIGLAGPVAPDLSVPLVLVLGPLAALVVHGAALCGGRVVPVEARQLKGERST